MHPTTISTPSPSLLFSGRQLKVQRWQNGSYLAVRRFSEYKPVRSRKAACIASGQTPTITQKAPTITQFPVHVKEKSPKLDDGGIGFRLRDNDGGSGGGGSGGGGGGGRGGGGGNWFGGFFLSGFLEGGGNWFGGSFPFGFLAFLGLFWLSWCSLPFSISMDWVQVQALGGLGIIALFHPRDDNGGTGFRPCDDDGGGGGRGGGGGNWSGGSFPFGFLAFLGLFWLNWCSHPLSI